MIGVNKAFLWIIGMVKRHVHVNNRTSCRIVPASKAMSAMTVNFESVVSSAPHFSSTADPQLHDAK